MRVARVSSGQRWRAGGEGASQAAASASRGGRAWASETYHCVPGMSLDGAWQARRWGAARRSRRVRRNTVGRAGGTSRQRPQARRARHDVPLRDTRWPAGGRPRPVPRNTARRGRRDTGADIISTTAPGAAEPIARKGQENENEVQRVIDRPRHDATSCGIRAVPVEHLADRGGTTTHVPNSIPVKDTPLEHPHQAESCSSQSVMLRRPNALRSREADRPRER